MAVIKLVEDYQVAQLRRDVRESLMMAGEQAILLSLYHPEDKDAQPCPQCGDDIYKSPEMDCETCYGTTFNGGVRTAGKIWALFSDTTWNEVVGPRGTHIPDDREAQFEAFPQVTEHDIIVRIAAWEDGVPADVEGYSMLKAVTRRSLRTGARPGQFAWDAVAQKCTISHLPEHMKGITRYPIVGKTFPDSNRLYPISPPPGGGIRW